MGQIQSHIYVWNIPGILKRRASGGERARFLEEESEPRNKEIFLAGENLRPDVSGYQASPRHICKIVSVVVDRRTFPLTGN
jgi:hypothetical protein